jgi:ABC-type uncharacterized transport system involved in gliding motility auxiliary subunit
MNKSLLSTTGLILAIVLFIAFNIVVNGNFKSSRLDLTEDKLYTLSDGSLHVIESMTMPVTLRFYYSETAAQALPSLKAYAQRVQELLLEYERESDGMIRLYMMSPEPISKEETRAKQYGLQAVPIDGESDPLYFGLAGTNLLDGLETMPFFQPEKEDTLEYDLTKMIYTLSKQERKTIGVISALEVDGEEYDPLKGEVASPDGAKPWPMMAELREMFNVTTLPKDIRRIPSSVDALIVVHPKEFADSTLYAIDQYVLRGGKLIAFVDPYAELDIPEKDPDNPMSAMLAPRSSNLQNLFNAWGVERASADVVSDRKTAMKVDFGAKTDYKPIDYVLWQSLDESNFNQEERMTASLQGVTVATPGFFKLLDDRTTTVTPLLSSSNEAMLVDKRVVLFRNDPVALLTKYAPGTLSYPFAVRMQGEAKTAYPDGARDKAGKVKKMPGHLDSAKDGIDVVAVADVDMLNDRFWVEIQDFYGQEIAYSTSNNIDFLINAVEDMTGSQGLISVRSRVGFTRPFHRVIELQRDAEKRFRTKERDLQKQLKETQQRIARMQVERSGSGSQILTPEQEKEIAEFRLLASKTEQQLRDVQANLRKDIDNLDTQLKFYNIGLVPLLICLLAVFTGWMRIRKRNKARAHQ